ncbi:MAG: Fic family protein [Phascolarctobacterium sp.]|nr:Fic family protein [Candidatus Phascolarctobacterium caballi]
MDYVRLKSMYYKDEELWKKIYSERFNQQNTKKLPFSIKQYQGREEVAAFFVYDENLTNLLEKVLGESLGLIKFFHIVPEDILDRFTYHCLIDEIVATNNIEGINSSKQEVEAAYDCVNDKRSHVRSWSIVKKYRELVEHHIFVVDSCQAIRKLYDEFVLPEVLEEDKKNGPDGKIFRQKPVDVVTKTGKAVHSGVMPEAKIIEMMDIGFKILHSDDIPLLLRIGIFHFLFAYIHPFYDGNGRMNRLISSYLLNQVLDVRIALQLSAMMLRQRKKYYDMFMEANDYHNLGDLTPFLIDFLQLILDGVNHLKERIFVIRERCADACAVLNKKVQLDSGAEGLCYMLICEDVVIAGGLTVNEMAKRLKVSVPTVKKYLKEIPQEYLRISNSSKPYIYSFDVAKLLGVAADKTDEFCVRGREGIYNFDYTKNGGLLKFIHGVSEFSTVWECGDLKRICIRCSDLKMKGSVVVPDVDNIVSLNKQKIDVVFDGQKKFLNVGDAVIWENKDGRHLAVKVKDVQDVLSGNEKCCLSLEYAMLDW